MSSRPKISPAILSVAISLMLLAGCGKSTTDTNTAGGSNVSGTQTAAAIGPGANEKACFYCSGEGLIACRAPGCQFGKVECPGPCLKLTHGTWIHKNVAGHPPTDLWISFPKANGGSTSWNQGHVGDVIQMQNGDPVDIGPCKICNGTTRVTCSACKGSGTQTCQICEGKKFIPLAWSPTNNPWLNSQPDLIRLADGRVLLGKVLPSTGDDRSIRTRDGHVTHVKASEILSSASNPATPAK